jgi:ketosteroid isomerase-like protein
MAQDDVEVVRDQFAATNERDFARAMGHYAEDVVLVVESGAFLESGTFKGSQAVGEWFANWFATFEPGYHFEIQEVRVVGDVVFLDATHRGRGRTSGVEVRGRTGYLYTVSGGKIVRLELYRTPQEALEAASARR